MTDFLLELRSEEIPARMQDRAREDLARLFAAELARWGLAATETITYATPRRLALIARGLPEATQATREETKGPKAAAPPQALDGFLRKTGLTREQLVERDGVLFAVREIPGQRTTDVLREAVWATVHGFPWPKSMRWGDQSRTMTSLRWVRPLSGIVALFGDAVVPDITIDGLVAGRETMGHRFQSSGMIAIHNAASYADQLRAAHVIVDQAERRRIIAEGATEAARGAGLELIPDEGLLAENAGLTEWPVALLGRFDQAFLSVPPEVIQLTARVNQKYFVCRDAAGALANAFVCIANIAAADGGRKIVEGNAKVLAARLSDAKFFYETDLKVPLDDQARKLDRIVFHEKLGTVADKVERVAKLARWLVKEGIVSPSPRSRGEGRGEGERATSGALEGAVRPLSPEGERETLAALAERAARLCKADLVTGMVGEFPELQGVMGGYYATAQGEAPEVAAAIRDHYKPVGQGDDVPTDPVTVAVSLADKLDTLVCFFAIKERPTGSKDPFALRRAFNGVIEAIDGNSVRVDFSDLAREAYLHFTNSLVRNRHVLWQDYDDDHLPSRLLDADAAYVDGFGELVVLNGEPPLKACEFDSEGTPTWDPIEMRRYGLSDFYVCGVAECVSEVTEFCFDRLREREKRAGRRPDLISAVMPRNIVDLFAGLGIGKELKKLPSNPVSSDLVRLLHLSSALQSFITTEDGANLLAGYKRAANILKKEDYKPLPFRGGVGGGGSQQAETLADRPHPNPSPEGEGRDGAPPEPAEAALAAALAAAEPAAAQAIAREDFEAAMAALATLRAPIDAFFETVTVNDPDAAKRAARLALLDRVRAAVHGVADFSKIEG